MPRLLPAVCLALVAAVTTGCAPGWSAPRPTAAPQGSAPAPGYTAAPAPGYTAAPAPGYTAAPAPGYTAAPAPDSGAAPGAAGAAPQDSAAPPSPGAGAADSQAELRPRTEAKAAPRASATVDPDAKVIYLTFDDGPMVPYTRQILDVLADNGATATFFVVGSMVARQPQLIAKIKAGGHAIGNHTWSHTALTPLSDGQIRSELQRTTAAVGQDLMGACMRPPYGDRNDRTIAVARREGYKTVVWTHWARDWEQPPVPQLVESLKLAAQDQANILLHDGGGDRPNTVAALRIMLPKWKKQGFTFAAVPACARPLR